VSAETVAGPAAPGLAARRIRTVLLVWAAFLVAADLAIKALAEAVLSTGATTDLGLINIRLLYNPGVAFSLGADLPSWVVIAATGLIITALVWYALKTAPAMTTLSRAGAALLLGGALGNFIDRLDGRGVVDYLHSGWFPTFNLADAFVTIGVGLYVLGTLRPSNR
jgi:signal peptidase II